jgi:hypothetical protein
MRHSSRAWSHQLFSPISAPAGRSAGTSSVAWHGMASGTSETTIAIAVQHPFALRLLLLASMDVLQRKEGTQRYLTEPALFSATGMEHTTPPTDMQKAHLSVDLHDARLPLRATGGGSMPQGPCGRSGVRDRWCQNTTLGHLICGHLCSQASDKYRRRMRLEETTLVDTPRLQRQSKCSGRSPTSTPHRRPEEKLRRCLGPLRWKATRQRT